MQFCFHGPTTVHIHGGATPADITAAVTTALTPLEGQIMTDIHDEIDAALAPVVSAIEDLDADLARELADFGAQVAPKLSQDEKDRFAAIAQRLADFDASINAADPATPVVTDPGTPDTGDTGSGDPIVTDPAE